MVREYAFNTLGLFRLVSIMNCDNGKSIRVAEKIGFHYEKDIEFKGKTQRLYSLEKREH